MTSPRKLTAQQEDEIISRVELFYRCDEWLKANGPSAIARRFNLTTSHLARLVKRDSHPDFTDEVLSEMKRLYRHAKRVRAIWTANSRITLKKEFRISDDRIHGLMGMRKVKGKRIFDWRDTLMGRFAVMRLPCSIPGQPGYY